MTKIPSQRYDFRPRKGQSSFDNDPAPRRVRTASMDPQNTKKDSDLGKLPAEIWGMIFEHALSEEWNGTMPAIIKALRADNRLYPECMLAWYKQKHTYVLHAKNNWSFLDMPVEVIATITKVEIIIDENIALHPLLTWVDMRVVKSRLPMSLNDLAITAGLATSVTSVTLDCRPNTTNLYFWYPQKFSLFFSGFKHLKYAATTCPIKPSAVESLAPRVEDGFVSSEWQESSMKGGIKEANSMLGGVAKLGRVYADAYDEYGRRAHRKYEYREKWVWAADEGGFLKEIKLPDGLKMERRGSKNTEK